MTASDKPPSLLKKYLYILQGRHRKLALMVLLFVLLSFMDILGIGLVGPFVAAILSPESMSWMGWVLPLLGLQENSTAMTLPIVLGGFLVGIYVAKGFLVYWVQRRILTFGYGFQLHIIGRLMRAFMHMPYRFYLERNSSTVVQSITGQTKMFTDDFLIPSLRMSVDLLMFVVLGAFLLWINPLGTIIFICFMSTVLGLYIWFIQPRLKEAGQVTVRSQARMIRGVSQALDGIREVRILGLEEPFCADVETSARQFTQAQLLAGILRFVPRYLMETMLVLFVIPYALLMLAYSGDSTALFQSLAIFGAAAMRMVPAMSLMGSSVTSMNFAAPALDRIYADLTFVKDREQPQLDQSTSEKRADPFETLELVNVGYVYPGTTRPALEDISLKVERGQSIGIVGESGSGKTTLIDVILGLHEVDAGALFVNGIAMEKYGLGNWRKQIAYIPQNVFLIDATLERNIAFGIDRNAVDQKRFETAIESAQLSAFVAQLPNGTQTIVGEHGARISGGERQRVALARAFYHNRTIFVFDEATSALDAETEREVVEVIEKLHGKITLITIAHRLETLHGCDTIYRLHKGRLVERRTTDGVESAWEIQTGD